MIIVITLIILLCPIKLIKVKKVIYKKKFNKNNIYDCIYINYFYIYLFGK